MSGHPGPAGACHRAALRADPLGRPECKLVPGIHVLKDLSAQDVDGRDKPGHDDEQLTRCTGDIYAI